MKKHIFAIFLILLSAGIFVIIFHVSQKQKSKPNSIANKQEKIIPEQEIDQTLTTSLPTIIIKGITIKEGDGKKGYDLVITANESKVNHLSSHIECYDILCNISRHENPIASVHAKKSFINRLSKKILFGGPVLGTFKELTFKGQDILYNFSTHKVHTQKKITFTHPNFTFSANSSTVNIKSQKIQMSNGVYSEILNNPTSNNSRK